MEWKKKNEYNSFNSWKGLLYKDWFEAIKEGQFLPPVEVSLDPIHDCNLLCEHCNAHRYLVEGSLTTRRMDDGHFMSLIRFLGEWGVKAICFGGGGEPTMHSRLVDALYLTKECGMEASVATNGTLLTPELIKAMALTCRWVGVSVDSGTPTTYTKGRKKPLFDKVIENIGALADASRDTKCDVAFKFLIMPYNQNEIYPACLVAKELGVKDFHARPADFRHQGMGELKKKQNEYSIWHIKEQFERCHEIESDDFRVFTVMHKFDEDFKPRKDFSKCYAAPLCLQVCADGNCYFCVDQRHQKDFILGTHYPEPKNILNFWGGEKHKAMVFGDTAKNCTTRCTFSSYCRMYEQVFMDDRDSLCQNFV